MPPYVCIPEDYRKHLGFYEHAAFLSSRHNALDAGGDPSLGEFGRAPRIDAGAGRGHWPGAMSAVLAGGGIRAGQIIGSTDATGSAPKDRPLGPGDLLASIYHALGIDSQSTVRDRQNRPIPILESGQPIAELF